VNCADRKLRPRGNHAGRFRLLATKASHPGTLHGSNTHAGRFRLLATKAECPLGQQAIRVSLWLNEAAILSTEANIVISDE
jgi:hypothetical protein